MGAGDARRVGLFSRGWVTSELPQPPSSFRVSIVGLYNVVSVVHAVVSWRARSVFACSDQLGIWTSLTLIAPAIAGNFGSNAHGTGSPSFTPSGASVIAPTIFPGFRTVARLHLLQHATEARFLT